LELDSLLSVLGKITFKLISGQNQIHLSKIDLKSTSKSLTFEVISNQNHFFGVKVKIKITFEKIKNTNYY